MDNNEINGWVDIFMSGQGDLAFQLFVSDPDLMVDRSIALAESMIELCENGIRPKYEFDSNIFRGFKYNHDSYFMYGLDYYWRGGNQRIISPDMTKYLVYKANQNKYMIMHNTEPIKKIEEGCELLLCELMKEWCSYHKKVI